MTFSTNQARQLYVAVEKKDAVTNADNAGAIAVKSNDAKTHLYFQYKGAESLMRSDLIDVNNIISIKVTDADSMAYAKKSNLVALNPNVNGGNLVAGQDYLLRITFRQYVGISDEDMYMKYGIVHAYSGMTPATFYLKMAESLVRNFSREYVPLVRFGLKTSGAITWVDMQTNFKELYDESCNAKAAYVGMVIEEVDQPWTLGIKPQVPVYFTVQPTTIMVDGDELIWGTATDAKLGNTIANGHKIADLEYFCMGERGDIYRNVNWPHSIPTKYLVDPTKKYNCIDIHYFYTGTNENVQKSEKDLTIVVPKVGDTNAAGNALANTIVDAIATATGLTIDKLNTASSLSDDSEMGE